MPMPGITSDFFGQRQRNQLIESIGPPEPNDHTDSVPLYLTHELYLSTPFCDIALIDTQGVYPQLSCWTKRSLAPSSLGRFQPMQEQLQIVSSVKEISIDFDVHWKIGVAPCIRERAVDRPRI